MAKLVDNEFQQPVLNLMNLADKTIINIISQSSGPVFLLLTSMVFVRVLSQDEYGTFLQIALVSNAVIMLGFLGLPQSIYYFFQNDSRKDLFIIQTIIVSISISVCFIIILVIFKDPIVNVFGNSNLYRYYWVILLLVFFGFFVKLREPFLWSIESLILNAYLTLISSFLQLGFPLLGYFWHWDLHYIIICTVLGNAINFFLHFFIYAVIFFRMRKEAISRKDLAGDLNRPGLWKQLCYALPIGLSSYVGVIGKEMDKYFISSWFNPAEFAVYSRGALDVPLISSIRFTVTDIMMPRFIRLFDEGKLEELLSLWHRITEHIAKINFAVAALLFALAPSLIRILYTESYIDAVPIFRVYLLTLITGIAVYGMIPRVSGQTRLIFWAAILNLPINVSLSLILISIGPIGPSISTVIASTVAMFWLLKASLPVVKTQMSKILPWNNLSKIILSAILSSIPIYATETMNEYSGVAGISFILAEVMLFIFLYFAALRALDLLSDEEKSFIRRWSGPLPVSFILG